MTETLVVRLGTDPGNPVEWVVADDTGAVVTAPSSGPLDGAAASAAGRRVVVLLPAALILRTRTEVPVKGTGRIAQALPFALEDQVTEDVEELHFAAGTRLADGQVAVAVVRREHLTRWLAALAGAGIHPQGVYAESDALADIPGTAVLLLEAQQAILRDAGGDPVVWEPDALDALLEVWLAQARPAVVDGVVPPRNLQVYDATNDGVANDFWQALQERLGSLEVRRLPDGSLLRLAAGIVTSPGVNLLQGDFAPRSSLGSYWVRWRLAASLVLGLGVLALISSAADAWRLRQESAALAIELEQAVSYTFPGTPAGADIRGLVSARLQAAPAGGNAGQGSQFLSTLRTVADAVTRTGSASIESLNYRAGVLELQVRAPSAETLDGIRRLVAENGQLKAEIQSSNAVGEQIQGRIRITTGGG